MAKILFINSFSNGSTGTICKQLYSSAEKDGHKCLFVYGRGVTPMGIKTIKIGTNFNVYSHAIKARLLDASGFGSKLATKKLIKKIEEFKPDIIHMHNLHGYYLNIEIFFDYLKKHPEIKKIWTLHDCWPFTGHCAYYTYKKCYQWEKKCNNCVNKNEYPKTILSRCNRNYVIKRNLFTSIENLTLITPSVWLKQEVENSYLAKYPVEVINNGVDTEVFKHVNSNIKDKYNIRNKKIILGVASVWDKRKGIDAFIELSKNLGNEYQIVLIGLSDKQIKKIPPNVIGINRTNNIQELVEWYSCAYIFFNPTLEDNYPTTNLEAIACQTPVVTFNTGGSPESAKAEEENIISLDEMNDFFCFINYDLLKDTVEKIDIKSIDKRRMCKNYCMLYKGDDSK